MAPADDPAFQQAMDKLMVQVDADNILAVHRAFRKHADELLAYLQQTSMTVELGLCGLDPVSYEVRKKESIGGKIAQLFEVHWRHWEELDAVARQLRETARSYGHSEDEIQNELRDIATG